MLNIKNEKVSNALSSLLLHSPFFAARLLSQRWEECEETGTFSVDGRTVRYAPAYADKLTLDECKGVLAHEAMHLVLLHHCRMGDREADLWNKACDYAINPGLIKAGFALPDGVLNRPDFDDMSAEDIYRVLQQEKQQQQNQGKGQGGEQDNAPTFGQIETPNDVEQATEQAKIDNAQAETSARLMGQLPAFVSRAITKAKEPKHDWRETLRRFLTEVCAKDYSFLRPNKRMLHTGFILPSLYSRTVGKFILAIDTSGSITQGEVSAMVSETLACLESLLEDRDSVELTVIYCDSAIAGVETLTSSDDIPTPKGGGGTDFRPPFDYIDKEGLECAAMVYLTDGECDSFPSDPSFPVLWGLIRDNEAFNPPFGEAFKVEIT